MSFWKREVPRIVKVEESVSEPAEKTSVELLAESVRLLKASLKLEADEKLAPIQEATQVDEDRLAEVQQTADTLRLRQALAYPVEQLAHHHAWIKQDDKYRIPADGIYITAGDTKKVDGTDHIGLLLAVEGRPYVLSWERTRGYHGGEIYGSACFETEQRHPPVRDGLQHDLPARHGADPSGRRRTLGTGAGAGSRA
jgi:hypothetical protein